MFCSHCGKPAEGRFCAACGRPIAPDAVTAMAAELHRHRKQMRLMVGAFSLVFVVAVGLIGSWVMHAERAVGRALSGGETTVPTLRQPLTIPPAGSETPSGQAATSTPFTAQPQQQPSQVIVPGENHLAGRSSASSIDPKAVQDALTTFASQGKLKDSSPQQLPAPPVASSGSDRYPGSQPVEVKNADLPDIGIPVAGEVYTTSDSLATVISYYTERYPDAQVMEISGQKVIAVDRPGGAKVIAIGTTGKETRIAIVQQR
jgi:hypothetical protein